VPDSWSPGSWRALAPDQRPVFALDQQPEWPDRDALKAVLTELGGLPPLIFAGEARNLKAELARAAAGDAFVLQAGDCAETFREFSADRLRDGFKVILQMAAVLTYSAGVPVVKIGRVAGQFAKPRSAGTETIGDLTLPAYRGDMVNGLHFSEEARQPNPENILQVYRQAAATLNLLGGFAKGGFADLAEVHKWNMEFVRSSSEGQLYETIASGIDRAMEFMRVCRVDLSPLREVNFYSSHEALILEYEEALTRQDSTANNAWYDCSAHMLWIGTRTVQKRDSAHIEFLRGVGNPISFKVGHEMSPDHLLWLCEQLDPSREAGRLTLISRMGREHVSDVLPGLVEAVRDSGHPVVWMCDPMHGNTFTSDGGYKTRSFDAIFDEITRYFEVHSALNTWPGGIHLELTGDDVTECVGGPDDVKDSELHFQYVTACDPRLNARQSLDLAFRVAELLERRPRH